MSDQCKNCTMRGSLYICLQTDCSQHDSWMTKQLKKKIEEATKFFAVDDFDGEKLKWLKSVGLV